jgi:uncharacterized protein (DUF4415 family)
MRKGHDFTGAKRAKDVPHLARLQAEVVRGKTRITVLIDDDVLAAFRARAEREGRGYQALINAVLRAAIAPEAAPVTMETLRQVLRAELLKLPTWGHGGLRPGVDLDDSASLLDLIERDDEPA